jgi:hypothetical protein
MFAVPVKTQLPREAWAVAAVVALISTLSSLMQGPAVSVATDMPPPIERSADLVKASLTGGQNPLPGNGYSQ